ncbi:MAG: DUF2867 domain-containing protein [Acidobacteriota bacterium]
MVMIGVVVVAAIGPGEVERVAVDPQSAVAPFLNGCDYWDSYRMLVAGVDPADSAFLDAIAFQRGDLVAERPGERVYRGPAPGLVFYVSYACSAAGQGMAAVQMSTVVRTNSRKGRVYFFFVRPVHRLLMPWALRHFVLKAVLARGGRSSGRSR